MAWVCLSRMPNEVETNRVRVQAVAGLVQYVAGAASLNRSVKLFFTVTAFRGLVIATLQTVLNLYLYSLGYDARFIGFINGANALATLAASVILGVLADRIGRRPVLVVGGILYPLCILALALARSTLGIIGLYSLFGGVAAAYWVAGVPLLVAHTEPRQRVQVFSINSFLLWGLGPFGALIGGQVVEVAARVQGVAASSASALRVGIYFMAATAALGSLPYLFLKDRPQRHDAAAQDLPVKKVVGLFARLLTPDVILTFGAGAILTFIQLYFHLHFGLDPGGVGVVMAIGGILSGVGTLAVPVLARRWGNLRTTVRLQWTEVPVMAALALAPNITIAVLAYWAMLTARSMFDPVYTAFAQEQAPETYRGRLTGLYSATYSIGYSLGPVASGQLQKAAGFTPAFLMGTACYFVGAMLLYLFFAHGRPSRSDLRETAA